MRDSGFRPAYAVSAPTGRRGVAAGGAPAAFWRTVRNPWERLCFDTSAPNGRRKRRNTRRISVLSPLWATPSPRRGEKKRITNPSLSTGCASGRSTPRRAGCGRAAAPAATPPRPVGAKNGPAMLMENTVNSVTCQLRGATQRRKLIRGRARENAQFSAYSAAKTACVRAHGFWPRNSLCCKGLQLMVGRIS